MATIKIGDRDLQVRRPTLGFWDRCLKFEVTAKEKTIGAFVNEAADLISEAVSGNDGVTAEWLRDHLPFPPTDEWGALMVACGFAPPQKTDAPEGETPIQ